MASINNSIISPPKPNNGDGDGAGTSSSSSSSSSSPDFQLYSDRPEWSDVIPLPQNDGPYPIVSIAYSERFRKTFDYFRAVLSKDEMSERALQLTADCASLNPSNYTIWYYRRNIIKALKKDLFIELKYIDQVIRDNAKNYQVWHHRKCIVQWIKDNVCENDAKGDSSNNDAQTSVKVLSDVAKGEKKFIGYMICEDSKNYHAWQHRQWVISEFSAWDDELKYTEELIDDDVRNNSAWNHRYFVISSTTGLSSDATIQSEIDFTCRRIEMAPNNESSWNYLRGIMRSKGLTGNARVTQMCDDLYKNCEIKSPYLLGFIIDCDDETLSRQQIPDKSLLNHALSLCEELAQRRDTIRKEYWNFIAREFKSKYDDD